MMTLDNIKEYIVCINGGSGVIFQPFDNRFTYILTAKHVFNDINSEEYKGNVRLFYYDQTNQGFVQRFEFNLEENQNYFPHKEDEVDIAILKLPRITIADKLLVKKDIALDNQNYILAGFPNLRRNKEKPFDLNWLRLDNQVTLLQEKQFKRREADIGKNQDWDELVGSSGGGIFRIFGDYLLLAGIQSQVVNRKEPLGRVEFTPAEYFSEIVNESKGNLEDVLPYYMKCFALLEDDILKLQGCIRDNFITQVRQKLKSKIKDIDIQPSEIYKSELSKFLLVSNDPSSTLFTKELWISWLEYLIVLSIVKEDKMSFEKIKTVFNSVRIIHSNTDINWMRIMDDIFNSDFRGLADKGVLIVSNKFPPSTNIINENMISDISRAHPGNGEFITDTAKHPLTMFKFIHISAFEKECIEKNEDTLLTYLGTDINDLINDLKNKFNEILENRN